MLGGSSGLNYLVWDRASATEYDAWQSLGANGWNWNSMFTTIRDKVETFTPPATNIANTFNIHPNLANLGKKGPVQAQITSFLPNFVADWLPTFATLGIPTQQNALGGNSVGATLGPSSIDPKTRTRSYSASAYLWPNQNRANLRVIANATVTKVNLVQSTGTNWKATGINYVPGAKTNTPVTIGANLEVVLSAGSVNTPQLLELSGIGQPNLLKNFGITPKINLPGVGENLQDHQFSALIYQLKDGLQTPDLLQFNSSFASQQMSAFKTQKPSLFDSAVTGITYATLQQLVGQTTANAMIVDAKAQAAQNGGIYQKQYNIQLDQLTRSDVGQMELILVLGFFGPGGPPEQKTYITLLNAIQHPLSRGTNHIQSADPFVLPATDPQYFSKKFDLDVMVAGAKFLRKLASTAPFSNNIVTEIAPGPSVSTDADWANYVKDTLTTEYHPIGTASMLPQVDNGVVDPNLKVYFTDNLRVADASVIPLHIAAHIQATVYGIAERAADIIKAAHK
jgi:choline dehydrogenase-like flavoprotein